MKVKIITKEALPIAEVNDILVKLEKSGELSGSQQKIRDFTAKFNKINKSEATKLIKDLESAGIPRLTNDCVVEIVNLLPKNESELKTVFVRNKLTVSKEGMDKILSIIKSQ